MTDVDFSNDLGRFLIIPERAVPDLEAYERSLNDDGQTASAMTDNMSKETRQLCPSNFKTLFPNLKVIVLRGEPECHVLTEYRGPKGHVYPYTFGSSKIKFKETVFPCKVKVLDLVSRTQFIDGVRSGDMRRSTSLFGISLYDSCVLHRSRAPGVHSHDRIQELVFGEDGEIDWQRELPVLRRYRFALDHGSPPVIKFSFPAASLETDDDAYHQLHLQFDSLFPIIDWYTTSDVKQFLTDDMLRAGPTLVELGHVEMICLFLFTVSKCYFLRHR